MAENKKKNKKATKKREKLTPRVLRFCREYVISGNGYQSAVKAGYVAKSAAARASQLLTNENILQKIEELQKDSVKRGQMQADEIVANMSKIAKDDIGNYLTWKMEKRQRKNPFTGEKEDVEEMVIYCKDSSEIDTSNIKKVKLGKDGQFEFELYCKDHALKTLGSWAGLDKVKEGKNDKEENSELTHLLEEGV